MAIARPREDDPRYQRSLRALLDAVTVLLDAEPMHAVSITRIVETAGVTRPTFYQHFSDVADAARRAGLDRLAAAFPLPVPASPQDLADPDALRRHIESDATPVLAHLQANRAFYLRVLEGGGNVAFFQDIGDFVASRMLSDFLDAPGSEGGPLKHDLLAVMAGGVTWLTIAWLRDNKSDPDPVTMARRIAAVALASAARRAG